MALFIDAMAPVAVVMAPANFTLAPITFVWAFNEVICHSNINLVAELDFDKQENTHLAVSSICSFFLFSKLYQLFCQHCAGLFITSLCCIFYFHLLNKTVKFK